MSIVTLEITSLQIIIASENEHYKHNLKNYFNTYYPFVDVFLVNTIIEALSYFNDKPPFKFLIRNPTKPLDKEEVNNCKVTEIRDINLRLVLFQYKHNKAIKAINKNTIRYLKQEKHLFKKMNVYAVLAMLKHQGIKHRFYKVLAHGSGVFSKLN